MVPRTCAALLLFGIEVAPLEVEVHGAVLAIVLLRVAPVKALPTFGHLALLDGFQLALLLAVALFFHQEQHHAAVLTPP